MLVFVQNVLMILVDSCVGVVGLEDAVAIVDMSPFLLHNLLN